MYNLTVHQDCVGRHYCFYFLGLWLLIKSTWMISSWLEGFRVSYICVLGEGFWVVCFSWACWVVVRLGFLRWFIYFYGGLMVRATNLS